MSDPSFDRDPFEVVAESFLARFRAGQRPSIEEYAVRHPELADQIRELLPALVMVEQDLTVDRHPASGASRGLASSFSLKEWRLGDYRIIREVGRGGMGVVYEAEQVSLGRRVALKVLPRHLAGDGTASERFRREAKAAARLHHTNIVPVFEVGRDGEVAYYAMQFIRGQGLDQIVEELQRLRDPGREAAGSGGRGGAVTVVGHRPDATMNPKERALDQTMGMLLTGRLEAEGSGVSGRGEDAASVPAGTDRIDPASTPGPWSDVRPAPTAMGPSPSAVLPGGKHVSEVDASGHRRPYFRSVAQIGRQAAQGLAYAHARGVVHRDIKPSNLLLDTEGVVWITDFGLAKADDDGLTASGDILGTLRYMAPERFRGEADARADIYALGLTLYELLTLRPAYDSTDRLRMIERIKDEEPARPRSIDPQIPRDLQTIVLKAIDKHPDHRYPTAEAMSEDLRRFLADEPIKARQIGTSEYYWRWARRNPAVAALGGVLAAVLVMATVGSLLTAVRFARMARDASDSAASERGARLEADGARITAIEASKTAETARAASLAETYRATLSEVKALRAGHQLGWREEALADLARLAVMPTPRRDLVELRSEAVATIGEFEVKEIARLEAPGTTVTQLAFSPDSRTLVTASQVGNLDYWDVTGPKHRRKLEGVVPGSYGARLLFLPDGEMAFLDASRRVSFLETSGRRSPRSPIGRGNVKAIRLGGDREGRSLAVGWDDGQIDILDVGSGALRRRFDWDKSDFAFSPDGRWLAVQVRDGPIQLVPTSDQGDPLTMGHSRLKFVSLSFSPDGATLAGIAGRSLVLWDVASKRELMTIGGHKESISGVAFSPDGTLVATSCGDSMTRIWDARDGRPLAVLPGPWYMRSLAFSPDGNYLAASADPGPVCLYELRGRREHRRLVGHEVGSLSVAFHPRLSRLASSSDDHSIIVWDVDQARAFGRWKAHKIQVTGLAYSPDGSLLASTCGDLRESKDEQDFSIRLWDAETGALRKSLPRPPSIGAWRLAFDPTGRRLASGDEKGTLLLWDVERGEILRREALGSSPITSVIFLGEGSQVLVGTKQGDVALFDLERPGPPRRVHLPDGCQRMAVDARAGRAIIGDSPGAVIALSLPDLSVVGRSVEAHAGAILALAVSPDGRLLATSGMDRRVVLRDPSTFEALLTFPAWTGVVRDLAFDASGRWLALAGSDSDVSLWDLAMVHDELAVAGLAWDQPAPRVVSPAELAAIGERPKPQVPVIMAFGIDPAEFQEVRRLQASGIAASQEGRFADAVADLRAASERSRAIRTSSPDDPALIRLHGISLGLLASSLHNSKRPGETLESLREALAVYESLGNPYPGDLYNMACHCVMVSATDGRGSPEEREKLEARAIAYLRKAIAGDLAQFLPQLVTDRSLDPLRNRADFRDLIADARFPSDPFSPPSPIAHYPTTPGLEDPE